MWLQNKNCLIPVLIAIVSLVGGQIRPGHSFPPVQELPLIKELPDPFVMFDGSAVKSRADWQERRKPELRQLFQHYIYGYLPPAPEIEIRVVKHDRNFLDGRATYKEIKLNLQLPENGTRTIHIALFVPNIDRKPVPVFIAVNKCGNHTLVDYEGIAVLERSWLHRGCRSNNTERGSRSHLWAVENTIDRGYALATFSGVDLSPDDSQYSEKIQLKYRTSTTDRDSEWGTLAVWAWGLQRLVDYLETDAAIDTDRICATGWSRRGKAALFAAAMDDRIDLVIPHQSGTGGMALSRMNPSETVARITEKFPHWFNRNFAKFGGAVEHLPIDQHLLIALVAPRPLMDSAGKKDTWASPHLALEAMKAATPVYEFLGEKGIVGKGYAEDDLNNIEMGRLFQHQRDTEHLLNVDYWNAMMDFTERQLGKIQDN